MSGGEVAKIGGLNFGGRRSGSNRCVGVEQEHRQKQGSPVGK